MAQTKRIWGTLDPFLEGGPILGRKVANGSFLTALLKADPFDEYRFFLGDQNSADTLRVSLAQTAPALSEAGRVKVFDRHRLPRVLAKLDFHCFHLSDCITSQPAMARLRNRYSRSIFPITGTIHSLSDAGYGAAFLRHLWPGTTGRDAIVCTSGPGMETVSRYFSWLRESYALDAATHPAPGLHRIPLAVDPDEYSPATRKPNGPVRLLVFGRIAHHSKMDLLPLFRALHRLITDGMARDSVILTLAGWGNPEDDFLPTLQGLAANLGIPLKIVLRPDERQKSVLFREADIFISIADNPQETFGITLLEAGAFGLPVIASDYDGYRDIVVHGETGLLVPTMGVDATPDADVMAPLTYDNQYLLQLAQRTAVDVPMLAQALKTLIDSPEQRADLGRNGRKRILSRFTWERVIEQHVALWDELHTVPVDPTPLRTLPHPLAIPYGTLFSHYPTRTLSPETMLQAGRTGEAYYRGLDAPPRYSGLTDTIDMSIVKNLVFFARKPVDSATLMRKLVEAAPHLDDNAAKNHVMWALKHDILEYIN